MNNIIDKKYDSTWERYLSLEEEIIRETEDRPLTPLEVQNLKVRYNRFFKMTI